MDPTPSTPELRAWDEALRRLDGHLDLYTPLGRMVVEHVIALRREAREALSGGSPPGSSAPKFSV